MSVFAFEQLSTLSSISVPPTASDSLKNFFCKLSQSHPHRWVDLRQWAISQWDWKLKGECCYKKLDIALHTVAPQTEVFQVSSGPDEDQFRHCCIHLESEWVQIWGFSLCVCLQNKHTRFLQWKVWEKTSTERWRKLCCVERAISWAYMQSSKHNVLNLRCFIRENVVKDFSHQAETSGIKSVLENLHSH